MERLYRDLGINLEKGISIAIARLDVLSLLLFFYESQNLFTFGGIDPRLWCCRWKVTDEEWSPVTPIPDVDHSIVEIEREEAGATVHSIHSALWYVDGDQERSERFWHAVRNLKTARLVTEVIHVWDKDPVQTLQNGRPPELQYPLYIFNQRPTESEPFLSRDINSFAMAYCGTERFFDSDGTPQFGAEVSTFRYISPSVNPYTAVSVLRLRYRPHDRDCGFGMEELRRKHSAWSEFVSSLKRKLAS